MDDDKILHEEETREVISDQVGEDLEDASDVDVLVDIEVAEGVAPTAEEYDTLVASHNKVLEVLRDSGMIPTE